jgi:uncharacterized ferredoxin-like protein
MIINERENRHKHLLTICKQMMTAARTAPKGKGKDLIECITITGKEIDELSAMMRKISEENGFGFFLRDADNILQSEAVVLIGTRKEPMGLNCEYCGFKNCSECSKNTPCALNSIDLGIAVGSACATAADFRVDTRIMYSAGKAALRFAWLKECYAILAIPVSASSKNPFFDRKPKQL